MPGCFVSHRVETQKLQELQSATEKVRREKWIEEKTKKIKVRGIFCSSSKIIMSIIIRIVIVLMTEFEPCPCSPMVKPLGHHVQ